MFMLLFVRTVSALAGWQTHGGLWSADLACEPVPCQPQQHSRDARCLPLPGSSRECLNAGAHTGWQRHRRMTQMCRWCLNTGTTLTKQLAN